MMRPFQIDPETLPDHLRHVVVLDFREAVPPGAMCERVRTDRRGHPRFVYPPAAGVGAPEDTANAAPGDGPVRTIGMLHVWLSDRRDVGHGSGWTRAERARAFFDGLNNIGHEASFDDDSDGLFLELYDRSVDVGDDDLFAEALRYLQAPYHISGGVASDGTPFVVLAHPANLYTHHGNEANRDTVGIGFAWGRDMYIGPPLRTTGGAEGDRYAASRRDTVEAALWLAHKHYGIRTLVTHAQASRGRVPNEDGSGGCPGANILWAAGVAPAMGIVVDWVRTWGSGRRPPPSWLASFTSGARPFGPVKPDPVPTLDCNDIACALEKVAATAGAHLTLQSLIKSSADLARSLGGGA